jgi:hypothetical protein
VFPKKKLAILAGTEVFEGTKDTVEMRQAVEAAGVTDVGDGVLRLGKLLLRLGDAAGLNETICKQTERDVETFSVPRGRL